MKDILDIEENSPKENPPHKNKIILDAITDQCKKLGITKNYSKDKEEKSIYSFKKSIPKIKTSKNVSIENGDIPKITDNPLEILFSKKENSINIKKDSFSFSSISQNSIHLPTINERHNNFLVINQEFNTTFQNPIKKSDQKDKYRFTTHILFRKDNEKKFSNVINNQSKYSSLSNTNNGIDESIKSNSFLDLSNHKVFQSRTNPSSLNNKNKSLIFSSSSNKSNDSKFKLKSLSNNQLDNFLHKPIKGNKFTWVAGEIISEGPNSIVYKSYNQDSGQIMAVKKFNCPQGKKCENFISEVQIYEQIVHPNIIKFISSEEIKNNYFIYLEFMPSGSLKSIIDKYGGFYERLIKKYTRQILNGLSYLHSKGIVHRDLKCGNILVDQKGNIKLSDFGCSKQISLELSDSSSNEEFCSSLKGTIPWCAPEVVCLKKYGKKADIWSLGCTIIEMTGNQPWGNLDNIYQVMNTIGKSNEIPDIPSYLSDNLKGFIKMCLVRDPTKRANLHELKNHPFLDSSDVS